MKRVKANDEFSNWNPISAAQLDFFT